MLLGFLLSLWCQKDTKESPLYLFLWCLNDSFVLFSLIYKALFSGMNVD